MQHCDMAIMTEYLDIIAKAYNGPRHNGRGKYVFKLTPETSTVNAQGANQVCATPTADALIRCSDWMIERRTESLHTPYDRHQKSFY